MAECFEGCKHCISFFKHVCVCTEKCFVEHNWFHLIGITCGLAIYNSTVVDLHFPLALYKKLLNVKPGLEDLKELSPTEGRYRARRWADRCGQLFWLPLTQGLKVGNTTCISLSLSNHMVGLSRCRCTTPCLRHCLWHSEGRGGKGKGKGRSWLPRGTR